MFDISNPCEYIKICEFNQFMKHQIYTLIFVQCINRNSKLPNSIVVSCDKFLGNSQTLTSIPYQIRNSLSGLKKPKLTCHWHL